MGEAAHYLFIPGSESPSELSELSLFGGPEVKIQNRLNNIPIREAVNEEGPLLSIKFLEGGAERICGGTVSGGDRFCTTRAEYCTTASNTWIKGSGEELPLDKEGDWVVMDPPPPCLTK